MYDESDLEFNVTNSKYGLGAQLGRIFSLHSTLLLDVSCTVIIPANPDNPSDGSPFNSNPKSDNYLQYQSSLTQRISLMQAFQVKVGLWFFCL